MATVFFPPQMRDLTAGAAQATVEGGTLRELLSALESRFPGLGARITLDDRIASGLAISIDGVVTSRGLSTRVAPTSEIHFLPAIGGG